MKFRYFSTALIGLSLSICTLVNVASATLITETWQGKVTETVNNNLFQVRETLSWTVTYDNTSLIMNDWNDGPDGVANTDDDYIDWVGDATCPSGWYCKGVTLFANAKMDLSNITDRMHTYISQQDGWLIDIYDRNYTQRYTYFGRYPIAKTLHDSLYFKSQSGYGAADGASLQLFTNLGSLQVSMGELKLVASDGIAVSEPTTLTIFALGMMGLVSRRFKKQ